MSFSELQVHKTLIKALDKLGYKEPTPVQNKVIPKILRGIDLRVSAPTGTGKTAAFLLPALTNIIKQPSSVKGKGARVLILVPTRELAIQVASQAEKYSRTLQRMKTICIYGGVPYPKQNRDIKNHHEIMVATPGRLIDHLDKGRISLARIEMFVLDEADRMLDMGFSEPVLKISRALPKTHQTLLFSATLKGNVMALSNKLLTNPLEINIHTEIDKKENIDQRLHYVDDIHHKQQILDHILKKPEIEQAIVFTSTKRQADKLTQSLLDMNYAAAKLHGDMNQQQRTKTIMKLRKGNLRILVATDVAARGIDVKTISHVINFDLPSNTEDYIHRIGRTARAGATGTAFSFATNRERGIINDIEKFIGKTMTCDVIPGLEPKAKTEYRKKPSSHKRSPRRNQRKFYPRRKSR
jgi:superfamily II DNA/RNA helicase